MANLKGVAKEFFIEQGRKSTEAIIQSLKKDDKTQRSLVNVFDVLFLQGKKLQQAKEKGSIRYIHIFLTLIGQYIIWEIQHVVELSSYEEIEKHPDIVNRYGNIRVQDIKPGSYHLLPKRLLLPIRGNRMLIL